MLAPYGCKAYAWVFHIDDIAELLRNFSFSHLFISHLSPTKKHFFKIFLLFRSECFRITRKSRRNVSYIWPHNRVLPVAKVLNSNTDTIIFNPLHTLLSLWFFMIHYRILEVPRKLVFIENLSSRKSFK